MTLLVAQVHLSVVNLLYRCVQKYTCTCFILGPSLAASGDDTSNKGLTIGLPVALVLLAIAVAAGVAIFILFKKR